MKHSYNKPRANLKQSFNLPKECINNDKAALIKIADQWKIGENKGKFNNKEKILIYLCFIINPKKLKPWEN